MKWKRHIQKEKYQNGIERNTRLDFSGNKGIYAAEKFDGGIKICGHSKGGNLAIYSGAYVDHSIQDRITEIWNLDGPGFLKDISPENEFQSIIGRLHSFVPQLSVVGMLFEQAGDHNVVKSDGKGFWQHSLYTWKLRRSSLLIEPDVDKFSRKFSMIMKKWLLSLEGKM